MLEVRALQILIIMDRFYVVIFLALDQTHCAFVVCDSKESVAFYSAF